MTDTTNTPDTPDTPDERKPGTRSARNMKAAKAATDIGTGAATVAVLDKIWTKVQAFAKANTDTDLPKVQMVTGNGRFGMPRGGVRLGSVTVTEVWTKRNADGTTTPLYELFVSGETLGRGPVDALVTILHEATHLLCMVRQAAARANIVEAGALGMLVAESDTADKAAQLEALAKVIADNEAEVAAWKDTTRQGRYHNGIFRNKAEAFGLEWTHGRANEEIGYSAMTLETFGQVIWAEELADLERLIPAVIDYEFVPVNANDPSDDRVKVVPVGGGVDALPEPKEHRRTYRCSCNRAILAYPSDVAEAPIICGRCGNDYE